MGHSAVVHGCTVEDGALIGMHATVLNDAVVGAGSIVAAGALVTEGFVVPPRSVVMGCPPRSGATSGRNSWKPTWPTSPAMWTVPEPTPPRCC